MGDPPPILIVMRGIGRWLLDSPWWLWVGGWIATLLLHGWAVDREGDALAIATWIPWMVFTVAVLLLPVRFIVRSRGAGGWRRAAAVVVALLFAAFVVQRLISPSDASKVKETVETVMTSTDSSYCSEDVTERFLVQQNDEPALFADDACEQHADYDRADSVGVTNVEVDGDR